MLARAHDPLQFRRQRSIARLLRYWRPQQARLAPFLRKENSMKRSPRKSGPDARALSPFQREFLACLAGWQAREGRTLSGRAFSALVGRSSNHFNLMVNGGFVPAGESIREMAKVLGLDSEARDRLLRTAIATKAVQRGRDAFWLSEAGRLLKRDESDALDLKAFLKAEGLESRFAAWKRRKK